MTGEKKRPGDVSTYAEQVSREIECYRDVANVHELPKIYNYWSWRYLAPKLASLGFASLDDFYLHHITGGPQPASIVSIGAGNCDLEIALGRKLAELGFRFTFDCVELNPHMLERGRQAAREAGLEPNIRFVQADLNTWVAGATYDIVLASHSLHHVVALEHLLGTIRASLQPHGWFLINDMIGRNGHMRWPEAELFVRGLFHILPEKYRYNHQGKCTHEKFVNFDCSREGFEGIRAQDILPLLLRSFSFNHFLGFCNIASIFIDRGYGHNFNPDDEWDRAFIDMVAQLDEFYLDEGTVKPTQMIAALTISPAGPCRFWGPRSPERSVRPPDSMPRIDRVVKRFLAPFRK